MRIRSRSGYLLSLFALLTLVAGAAAFGFSGSASAQTEDIHDGSLVDHGCNSTEWHFIINQIADGQSKPAKIHVVWANGDEEDVLLSPPFESNTAHYITTSHLDSTVKSATVEIYDGWSGLFNLSHGPCNGEVEIGRLRIEKSAPEDACIGSSVDYAVTVYNDSLTLSWTGSVVDDNGTPGNTADDVILSANVTIGPGGSQPFNYSSTITGTVTNTATAAGTFNDTASTAVEVDDSATVNGHACSISLTKTPDVTDVCTGSSTSVTYTYVVKNTGDFFTASGTVSDDKLGAIGAFGPLAPGASATLTKAETVSGSVTNTGTANAIFGDAAGSTASATAKATVNGHACSISLTKTPSKSKYCGTSTSVTYTYVVKNTGDYFTAAGSVSDNKLGSIGSFGPLAKGASATLTKAATVTGTVTNTATASGTSGTASVSATASATVSNTGPCPLTPGYWKNHKTETTNLLPGIKLGGFTVGTFNTATAIFDGMNCGTSTDQSAVGCLAGHLLAAKLNVKNGSDGCIQATIDAADAFLKTINGGAGYVGPTGKYTLTAAQRTAAILLKTALDNYNNGKGC